LILFIVGVAAILVRVFTPLGIPGWATYTTLIGLMGFVQSIVLAVIAEYVGIIFDEVKARPLYVVRNEFRSGSIVTPVAGEFAKL
jgi:dolichol-phosphate mannosyltransferase